MASSMIEGFSKLYHVQGRASIADLFPPRKRCGLYILHFTNGEMYAGQALDVTRRFVQHRKVHGDIEKLSFRRVPRAKLNDEERALIWGLEQDGYRLRNITFTSIPHGESDFDLIMPVEEQDRWLEDLDYIDAKGSRVIQPELRGKYSRKFESFTALPYADEAIEALRYYVWANIPAFLRSELSFWSCSCLPSYPDPSAKIYSRINVNWQEVFTVFEYENQLNFSFHVARSPLERTFGESLSELSGQYPDLDITDHFYEPGGPDQVNLVVRGSVAVREIMQLTAIVHAARLFNLRLMKKGPCIYSRYHCMDLADRLTS